MIFGQDVLGIEGQGILSKSLCVFEKSWGEMGVCYSNE